MSCFATDYQSLERHLEEFGIYVVDTVENFSKTMVSEFKGLIKEIDSFLFSEPVLEHTGVIARVEPLAPEIPEEYFGKCYHSIKMADGSLFKLIFDHIEFSELEPNLQRGYMIKVTYRAPNNEIVNVFPRPYYKDMTYEQFLDTHDISNLHPVRVCYYKGDLTRIEFFKEEEVESDVEETVESEHVHEE